MSKEVWPEFKRVSERLSAEALVEHLKSHGVPARVEAPQLVPGLEGYFVVCVEPSLLHRARWVAPEGQFTEAELRFIATGQLGPEHE